jgi:hypothetical protein
VSAVLLSDIDALEASARALCARLDPDSLDRADVDAVHAGLNARVERLVAGARVRLARRVEAVGGWRAAGERSAAHAIARAAGCSVARARAEVEASQRLAGLAATDAAVASGALSADQAVASADGAGANPAFEARLLRCAARRSLGELRDESARAKAAGDVDLATLRARVWAGRFLRDRDMLATGDPFLAAIVTRGEDVVNVAQLGRKARAVQATALEWRDPICVREGCNQTARLQTGHRVDWAATRHTVLHELDRLCAHDHGLKTQLGWALVAGSGKRALVPPDDPATRAFAPRTTPDQPTGRDRRARPFQSVEPSRTRALDAMGVAGPGCGYFHVWHGRCRVGAMVVRRSEKGRP